MGDSRGQPSDFGSNYYALKRSTLITSSLLLAFSLSVALPQGLQQWSLVGSPQVVRFLLASTAIYYLAQFFLAWWHEAPPHLGEISKDELLGKLTQEFERLHALVENGNRALTILEVNPSIISSTEQGTGRVIVVDDVALAVKELVTKELRSHFSPETSLLHAYRGPELSQEQRQAISSTLHAEVENRVGMINQFLQPRDLILELNKGRGFDVQGSQEISEIRSYLRNFGTDYLKKIDFAVRQVRRTVGLIRTTKLLAIFRVAVSDLAIPLLVFGIAISHYLGRDWAMHWIPSITTLIHDVLPH